MKYNKRHKIINGVEYKLCLKCNRWFPLSREFFYRYHKSNDGYVSNCIECNLNEVHEYRKNNLEIIKKRELKDYYENKQKHLIWMYRYYKNNKDSIRQYQRDYLVNNKDKVKKYNKRYGSKKHTVNSAEWESCKHYFNMRCAYCGIPIEEHYITRKGIKKLGDFHKEHVYHDGKNDLSNCVPSCRQCNTKKNVRTINEFYKISEKFTYDKYHKIYMWIRYDYKNFINRKATK